MSSTPDGGRPSESDEPPESSEPSEPRPLVERLGLGLIALILAGAFSAVSYVAFAGSEVFLGVMAAIGALMTLWAAASGLRRG